MKKPKLTHRILFIFLLCAMSFAAFYYFYEWNQLPSVNSTKSSLREAPKLMLPDAKGKIYRLADFKGKAVILHFWASWCSPCLDEIPQWIELGARLQGKKIQLVAVSLDQNWDEIHKVLPSQGLPRNVVSLIDLLGKVPDDFGTFQFPETYLINSDSKILFKWVGPQNWSAAEMGSQLEHMLD